MFNDQREKNQFDDDQIHRRFFLFSMIIVPNSHHRLFTPGMFFFVFEWQKKSIINICNKKITGKISKTSSLNEWMNDRSFFSSNQIFNLTWPEKHLTPLMIRWIFFLKNAIFPLTSYQFWQLKSLGKKTRIFFSPF